MELHPAPRSTSCAIGRSGVDSDRPLSPGAGQADCAPRLPQAHRIVSELAVAASLPLWFTRRMRADRLVIYIHGAGGEGGCDRLQFPSYRPTRHARWHGFAVAGGHAHGPGLGAPHRSPTMCVWPAAGLSPRYLLAESPTGLMRLADRPPAARGIGSHLSRLRRDIVALQAGCLHDGHSRGLERRSAAGSPESGQGTRRCGSCPCSCGVARDTLVPMRQTPTNAPVDAEPWHSCPRSSNDRRHRYPSNSQPGRLLRFFLEEGRTCRSRK